MFSLYARASRWVCVPHIERRIACLAFLCALPSLTIGLQADDYVLRRNVLERGALEAFTFFSRDPQVAHAQLLAERAKGQMPWWVEEHPRTSFFRPLSSLSAWVDFASGMPPWLMHLESCAIYALMVFIAAVLFRQLGLSEIALGWAALFFGLDGAIATPVGWLAGRNTMLAALFGLACVLFHERARRAERPALLAAACLCFALALLSAELGLCTLGYVIAYALTLDRAPLGKRILALLPYGVLTGVYLVHYVLGGYGASGGTVYKEATDPIVMLLAWLESIPVWLATTATVPIASLLMLGPDARAPILTFSLVVLAILVPLLAARHLKEPRARMFAIGAILSLVPLAAISPQERLRFLVSFGVYGVLGPWVASAYHATERWQRIVARFIWRVHGVWLPLMFVPLLFSIVSAKFAGGGATALDEALPRAHAPVAILLNPPAWTVSWFQVFMRAYQRAPNPPVYALYAGGQPLAARRVDERSLELHIARSWLASPFDASLRNLARAPFHAGDRLDLPYFHVEVREVDSHGAPTRVRFTFERALEDPSLAFRYWDGDQIARWTPPAIGSEVQLPAAKTF